LKFGIRSIGRRGADLTEIISMRADSLRIRLACDGKIVCAISTKLKPYGVIPGARGAARETIDETLTD